MPLTPGSKVGIYDIVEMIGVGGMGEVYRATDSRLDRPVAIKTLPEEFATDRDRLARFEREAKVLAQLNHPHIASIYGIEPGPPVALAMEMAEGQTLAHRIGSGPLPLDEAIAIARQIAEALEHAHAKGVIHRDLKPANIKIGSPGGDPHVKVLDFGLAKAMSSDAAGTSTPSAVSSPTITSPANLTKIGVVLGTAAYMAPEQARGRHVDHRADIWAFGCVLFEMLAGRRPFAGDQVADVLSQVLQTEPDWSLLPPSTPPALQMLLRRTLRKDPHKRVHSIADVRLELEEPLDNPAAPLSAPARASMKPAIAGLVVGAALAAMALIAWPARQAPPIPQPTYRFDIAPPAGWSYQRINMGTRMAIALSPDGRSIAAVLYSKGGERRIFVRRLDEDAFREIPGTDGAAGPFWSPDSSRIGFMSNGTLRVADVSGGGSRPLTPFTDFAGAAWSASDVIVAAHDDGRPLEQLAPGATTAAALEALPKDVIVRGLPRWLADSRRVIFVDAQMDRWWLRLRNADGSVADLRSFDSAGNYFGGLDYANGYVLLSTVEPSGKTTLTAQKLDYATGTLVGNSHLVASDVNVGFTASEAGIIAFGDNIRVNESFYWLSATGSLGNRVSEAAELPTNFDLSPDERFLVYESNAALKLIDVARGVTTALTAEGLDPVFSPDGNRIAFTATTSDRGIYIMPTFGGTPRKVGNSPADQRLFTEDWSPDGRFIAAIGLGGDAYLLSTTDTAATTPLHLAGPRESVDETRFSPDGRWLVYSLSTRGGFDVFLSPLPPTGQRWQLSVGGGVQPRWQHDGRAVYFLAMNGDIKRVALSTAVAPPVIQPPTTVAPTGISVQPLLDQFMVARDGRFLVRRPPTIGPPTNDPIHVIVNWTNLLKK